MRNKLKKAGIEPADEKLQAIGREIVAQQRNLDKAKDMLMARISNDAALMYEFTKPFHKEAARRLLAPLLAETRRAGHPGADAHGSVASSGAGQLGSDSHEFAARANQSGTDGGHPPRDVHSVPAPVSPGPAMRTVVRLTILDTFRTPLGQPYGEATLRDLEHALRAVPRKQADLVVHQRLLPMLINKMGPDGTVKQQIKPEEFEALKRAAEHVNHDEE